MAKELELISLQDVIPYSIAGDKNVQAILRAADPQLQEVSQSVREAFILSRLDELPENVIDLLAWQWHVDFYEPELPIETKRELVRESISWHRKKGTKAAIISALEKLDFVPTIKEWYEPELRTEPHTFSISGYYKDDNINVEFLGADTEGILLRVIDVTKPARSKLLNLTIAPIPIDLTDHICRWDFCTWEHDDLIQCRPVIFNPSIPLFGNEPDFALCFRKDFFTIGDSYFWDISSWDSMPSRVLDFSALHDTGIFASLEWGEGEASMLFPNLWDESKWDYASTFTRIVGSEFMKGLSLTAEFSDNQSAGSFSLTDVICDNRPKWDSQNWLEHGTWAESFRQEGFFYETTRGVSASLDWNDEHSEFNSNWDFNTWDNSHFTDEFNAPLPKWSVRKNWIGSNTWNKSTELCASWEIIFQEAE